ncbi:hypothetical protein D3C86_1426120 [compost metagenome]
MTLINCLLISVAQVVSQCPDTGMVLMCLTSASWPATLHAKAMRKLSKYSTAWHLVQDSAKTASPRFSTCR